MTDILPAVLSDLARSSGVVVDSPPGAGKSTLVVRAATHIAAHGEPLAIVAQTNEQVDDLIVNLARAVPQSPIGRLSAQGYAAAPRIARHGNVTVDSAVAGLAGSAIVIGTAAKWSTVTSGEWPCAIIDEAYQMRSDALLQIAGRFNRTLFVGDPGQLDPFSTVDTERWAGLSWDPQLSAVAVLLRHNPNIPQHRLPVSWRLPATAAPVVSDAFYPFTGFTAGTARSDRSLTFTTRAFGSSPVDKTLELAAETGWALHELPARHSMRTDDEVARACAAVAQRLVERGATAISERSPEPVPVTPDRIAIGTAHRDQAAAVRQHLPADSGITVDTANRLQGREYDVTVIWHPLSGRRDATAFHLEAGRLCVLTSRHRHACIAVARAGITELLNAHPSTGRVYLNEIVKFPDGWEANEAVMTHLEQHRVPA
ncbi:AAA family ATPase [Dactylosporangium matsuzakiense]|uniref:Helicase n=1 Tax=Dactylosporangium matsuzakiense TaxID=53360 RepID=A0A9W6KER9_9ACTN|nr:AAA family ATPase [Dactylosporangium matsuzakiense]UWZ45310.1 AAA family ATPase [Dactylosporangium matsuzakiense]GLK98714.1 helicase [Dactylosporangium matsuzakiense]